MFLLAGVPYRPCVMFRYHKATVMGSTEFSQVSVNVYGASYLTALYVRWRPVIGGGFGMKCVCFYRRRLNVGADCAV